MARYSHGGKLICLSVFVVVLIEISSFYKWFGTNRNERPTGVTNNPSVTSTESEQISGRRPSGIDSNHSSRPEPIQRVSLLDLSMSVTYDNEVNTEWNSARLEELTMATLNQSFFNPQPSLSRSVKGSMRSPLQFRTPCWVERYPKDYYPAENKFVTDTKDGLLYIGNFVDLHNKRVERKSKGVTSHMRCLPAFYIAGVYKGGSTDLSEVLGQHPDIIEPLKKEPLLSLWRQQGTKFGFEDYLQVLDISAEEITELLEKKKYWNDAVSQLIYDGTVTLLHSYVNWEKQPWNVGHSEPQLIIAHHLKVINPRAKYIFMLRNPPDWLESCFNYYSGKAYHNDTVNSFHNRTVNDISSFNKCLKDTQNVKRCAYTNNKAPCSIVNALYYVYLKQWLGIIAQHHILVIKSEDYFKSRLTQLKNIFKFLDMKEMIENDNFMVRHAKPKNKHRHVFKFSKETRDMVDGFVKPWNEKLALLLNDTRYLWK